MDAAQAIEDGKRGKVLINAMPGTQKDPRTYMARGKSIVWYKQQGDNQLYTNS